MKKIEDIGGIEMQQFQIRTDLALEATESVRKQASGQMRGVSIDEYDIMEDVHISKVVIMTNTIYKYVSFSSSVSEFNGTKFFL